MNGVLLVQAMHPQGHGGAQSGHLVDIRANRLVKPLLQGLAVHIFHDEIRHILQITGGHKTRHVGARQHLHDLVLYFKADDVLGTVTRRHARDFHRNGETGVARPLGVAHPVDVGHAAGVNALLNRKTVQLCAGFKQLHRPASSRSAKKEGRPARRMAAAAAG